MNTEISSKVTLWVNRGIALAVGLMLFLLSWVLRVYSQWRSLEPRAQTAIFVAYYGCAGVVLFAHWHIEKLLKSILAERIFVRDNVLRIIRIRWCCILVSLICLPAAFYYLPLIFISIIMGFLGLIVSVVVNVMDAAVKIREENDLTV